MVRERANQVVMEDRDHRAVSLFPCSSHVVEAPTSFLKSS